MNNGLKNGLKLSVLTGLVLVSFAGSAADGGKVMENFSSTLDNINNLPYTAQDQQLKNDKSTMRDLYSYGLVLPNQPLNIDPALRRQIRDMVQQNLYSSGFNGNMRAERSVLNAVLFNYGLQVLDNGRVEILDMYIPEQPQAPMLTPEVPMPASAVTLTKDNLDRVHADAVKKAQTQSKPGQTPLSAYDAEMGIK